MTLACHEMYRKVIGGELTLEEEETLKKLGSFAHKLIVAILIRQFQ